MTDSQLKRLNTGDRVVFRGKMGERVGGTVVSVTWDMSSKRPMVRLEQDRRVFGCPYFFAAEIIERCNTLKS